VGLIAPVHWILYVFGAFLVFTGIILWWARAGALTSRPNSCAQVDPHPVHGSTGHDVRRLPREQGVAWRRPLFVVILLMRHRSTIVGLQAFRHSRIPAESVAHLTMQFLTSWFIREMVLPTRR